MKLASNYLFSPFAIGVKVTFNRDLKIKVFRHFPQLGTSRSHVIRALQSGLWFEVYVCTAIKGSRGK